MKILMVCPLRPGTTKVGGDLGQAFAELGHTVAYQDYDDRPWTLKWLPRSFRPADYAERVLRAQNRALLDSVRRERPAMVMAVKGFALEPATVAAIKSLGAILAGYWIDDPLDHARSLRYAPSYDLYFTNDAGSVADYRARGIERAFHLPSSANPRLLHPLGAPRDLPIAFVGTRTDDRERLLRQLQEFPLHVFGPGWTKTGIGGQIRTHAPAFGAHTNEVFNRARINLNIHTWVGQGSAMNLRLFEVPAAGGFLLTDWVDEIAGHYVEGEHLACYRGLDDLKAKLEHYLARPEECERIAQAGHRHFLAHHRYAVRAQRVLEEVARLGGR